MGRQRIPKAILEARGSRITKYGDQRTGDNREQDFQRRDTNRNRVIVAFTPTGIPRQHNAKGQNQIQ